MPLVTGDSDDFPKRAEGFQRELDALENKWGVKVVSLLEMNAVGIVPVTKFFDKTKIDEKLEEMKRKANGGSLLQA